MLKKGSPSRAPSQRMGRPPQIGTSVCSVTLAAAWLTRDLARNDATLCDLGRSAAVGLLIDYVCAPNGELLVAVQLTNDAFTGPEPHKTGFFFYLEDFGPGIPLVSCYEYRRGKIVSEFGCPDFLRDFEAIGFESFDYQAELDALGKVGIDAAGAEVLDGAEYEIRINHRGEMFTLRTWNPGPKIDYMARHSPSIRKLKEVIDLAARHYGRGHFGIKKSETQPADSDQRRVSTDPVREEFSISPPPGPACLIDAGGQTR